jgi:ABC-type molybdate transport system substrate-binding protein
MKILRYQAQEKETVEVTCRSSSSSSSKVAHGTEYQDCSSVNIFATIENLLTEKRDF